jgi:hypothetical protein
MSSGRIAFDSVLVHARDFLSLPSSKIVCYLIGARGKCGTRFGETANVARESPHLEKGHIELQARRAGYWME